MKTVELTVTRRCGVWRCNARVGGTFFDKALYAIEAENILYAYSIDMPTDNEDKTYHLLNTTTK